MDEVRVGPILSADGIMKQPLRVSRTGAQAVTDVHAKYREAVSRGNVFIASMQSGAVLGTALTATAVTLTLYNPKGSGVRASILWGSVAQTAASATAGLMNAYWCSNSPDSASALAAATTAATVRNAAIATATAKVLAYTACTLQAAPIIVRPVAGSGMYWATAAGAAPTNGIDYVDGAIELPENTAITIQGVGASTLYAGIVTISWEEIPTFVQTA